MHKQFLLPLAALGLLVGDAFAQDSVDNDPTPPVPVSTERFNIGETLLYEVRTPLLGRLGRAAMYVSGIDTVRGDSTLHFQFQIRGSAAGVFNIDDKFDSWVGVNDFFSRRFTQDFNETRNVRQTAYEIFPDSGFYREMSADTAAPTSPGPLDDTAFFYFVRTLDLEPGDSLEFYNYFRPDRNPVKIYVLGRDTVETPAGIFPTIVIQPVIKGGLFGDRSDGRIWISDDDRRLIVQMRTKLAVFNLTMRLIDMAPGEPRRSTPEDEGSSGN
ncbi:MAG: DUF3108 domain-containing protein [Gemmatimonadota bacterium]|nr:DUF3108 domain-containing protein [Gemmatimonadota bacterium]MDH5805533.1 DUF3108 domain-containing protein [Gemmatimonadota bacterium]